MIDYVMTTWRIQGQNRQPGLIQAKRIADCQANHESFNDLINGQQPLGIKDLNYISGYNREQSGHVVALQGYMDIQGEDDYLFYLGKLIKILGLNINKLEIRSALSQENINFIKQEKTEKIYVYNKRVFFTQTYYPLALIRKIKVCSIVYCDYCSDGKTLHHLIFLDKDGLTFMRICNIDWQTDRKRAQNFMTEKLKSNFTVILNANLTKNNIDLTLYDVLQSINIKRVQANRNNEQKYKKTQNEVRNRIIVVCSKDHYTNAKDIIQKSQKFCIKDIVTKNSHLIVYQSNRMFVLSDFEVKDSLMQSICHKMSTYFQIFKILKQDVFNPIQFSFEQMFNINTLFSQLFTLYFNFLIESRNQIAIKQKGFKDRIHNQIASAFLDARALFIKNKETNRNLENSHFYGQLQNCKLCLVCLVNYNNANKEKSNISEHSKISSSKQEFLPKNLKTSNIQFKGDSVEAATPEKQKLRIKESEQNNESISEKNDEIRKRKTKYKCIGCSITFEKDIPLCILCFKQFHNDISKYLPTIKKRFMKKNKQITKFTSLVCSGGLNNFRNQKQQSLNMDQQDKNQIAVKIEQNQYQKNQKTNNQVLDKWIQTTHKTYGQTNQIMKQFNGAQQIPQQRSILGPINYQMFDFSKQISLFQMQILNDFFQQAYQSLLHPILPIITADQKPQYQKQLEPENLKKQQE